MIAKNTVRKACVTYDCSRGLLDKLRGEFPKLHEKTLLRYGKKPRKTKCRAPKSSPPAPAIRGTKARLPQAKMSQPAAKIAPSHVQQELFLGKEKTGESVGTAADRSSLIERAVEIERELNRGKLQTVYLTVIFGYYLLRLHQQLPHGQWESEVKVACKTNVRSARRYVALARKLFPVEFLKSDRVSDLAIPPDVDEDIKNKIGSKALTKLYEEYEITSKPNKAVLPKRDRLIEMVHLIEKAVKKYGKSKGQAVAQKAMGLIEKFPEWEAFLNQCFDLLAVKEPDNAAPSVAGTEAT